MRTIVLSRRPRGLATIYAVEKMVAAQRIADDGSLRSTDDGSSRITDSPEFEAFRLRDDGSIAVTDDGSARIINQAARDLRSDDGRTHISDF